MAAPTCSALGGWTAARRSRRGRGRRRGEQRWIDVTSVVDPPDGSEQRLVPVQLARFLRRGAVHAGKPERRPHRLEDARGPVLVGTRDITSTGPSTCIALGETQRSNTPKI